MRNVVMFLSVVFGMAAVASFPAADRGASGQPGYTGAVAEAPLLKEEAGTFVAGVRSTGISESISRCLLAMQENDDENDGDGSGFDRLWDVTCCG